MTNYGTDEIRKKILANPQKYLDEFENWIEDDYQYFKIDNKIHCWFVEGYKKHETTFYIEGWIADDINEIKKEIAATKGGVFYSIYPIQLIKIGDSVKEIAILSKDVHKYGL